MKIWVATDPHLTFPFCQNLQRSWQERHHHILINDLYDIYQYAYCKDYSTQTALITVHSDITDSLDEGSIVALVLLDLSASDVIDHTVLIRCVEFTFGIEHKAMSYLMDRI